MTNKPKSTPVDPFKYAENASDEHGEQVAIFAWCALPNIQELYPELKFLFAVPNGMYTNKIQAGKFKAAGLKSGVPDMWLPVKRGEYSGLIIELKPSKDKAKYRKPTDNQDMWIEFLKSQGFGALVCYGFKETIDVLQEYLNYKKPRNWSSKQNDIKEFEE